MGVAAFYGLLAGSTYAIIFGVINVVSYPDLPLKVDWGHVAQVWLAISGWLVTTGLFVGWFTDDRESLIPATIIVTLLVLVASAYFTRAGVLPLGLTAYLLLLPILGITLTATYFLRRAASTIMLVFERNLGNKPRTIMVVTLLVLLTAGTIGVVTRLGKPGVQAVSYYDQLLQQPADTPLIAKYFPEEAISHLGMDYHLSVRVSSQIVTGYDVTTWFADGFDFTCLVIGGENGGSFINSCWVGSE
jgi:hypothetical protein